MTQTTHSPDFQRLMAKRNARPAQPSVNDLRQWVRTNIALGEIPAPLTGVAGEYRRDFYPTDSQTGKRFIVVMSMDWDGQRWTWI